MAYKPRNFTDDLMLGINSFSKIGDAANEYKKTKASIAASEAGVLNDNKRTDAAVKASAADTNISNSKFARMGLEDSLRASIGKAQGERMALPEGVRKDGPSDQELMFWSRLQDKPIDEVRAGIKKAGGEAAQVGLENEGKRQTIDYNANLQPKLLKGKDLENEQTEAQTAKTISDTGAGHYAPVPLEGGEIGAFDTKRGGIGKTGAIGAPKPGAKNAEFNALPMEAQEQVKKISQSMGFQKTLKGSVASDLEQFKAAKTPDAALSYGLGMLKALNSTLGPDALSNDEADRLGAELKLQIGNWRGPGKFAGRDLSAFVDKVQAKVNSLDGSIKQSQTDIDALYGRTPPPTATPDPDPADPKVKEALANGWTMEEIKAHLGKK